jgi:hypothetical protein
LGGTSSGDSATLVYYAKIPPLSSTNVTNWLLTDHPDAYLYGALMQAAIKYQDSQAATGYGTLFTQALNGIQGLTKARWASGPSMYSRLG